MDRAFRFQDPGEGIHEAEIRDILVNKGDRVREGQQVLVVETDKAAFELNAPFSGVVSDVAVHPGDKVRVGDPLMTFGEEDEEGAPRDSKRREEPARPEPKTTAARPDAAEPRAEAKREPETAGPRQTRERRPETAQPDSEAKGEQERPEPDSEAKGEPERPVAKRERERERPEPDAGTERRQETAEPRGGAAGAPVAASPSTRRLARELGVDLRHVTPSGDAGRVTDDDVRSAATRGGERAGAPESPELPDFEHWGPVEREPLRSIRAQIARHMQVAWSQVPHANHQDSADVTDLDALRRRLAEKLGVPGKSLTLSVLVMKAVAAILSEFPRLNASVDARKGELVLKRYHHLGFAVDTERGLVVPVVRDVDRKTIAQLATEVAELAERTRRGEARRDELVGGTFTITNIGSLGGTSLVPLVNFPEVAILGLARARLTPVVRGSLDRYELTPRLVLPLSLSFDHRVVDGADAARFMNRLIAVLSDPEVFTGSI